MKTRLSITLDEDVGKALEMYYLELVKGLPVSMQKGSRMRSQVVNDILKEFLQKKGYLNDALPT